MVAEIVVFWELNWSFKFCFVFIIVVVGLLVCWFAGLFPTVYHFRVYLPDSVVQSLRCSFDFLQR